MNMANAVKALAASRPAWARGLKRRRRRKRWGSHGSRPAWARGLKLKTPYAAASCLTSRPAWARGLKLSQYQKVGEGLSRAPRGRVD